MTSITEILTIVFLIICVLVLPRIFRQENQGKEKKIRLNTDSLSTRMRAGIVLSFFLPFISALVLKPWKDNVVEFVCIGIIPVLAGWACVWMVAGFRKSRK
ncbi:MAG: hypothetical protein R6V41_05140 [Desulfobacteraceae bacterium]